MVSTIPFLCESCIHYIGDDKNDKAPRCDAFKERPILPQILREKNSDKLKNCNGNIGYKPK